MTLEEALAKIETLEAAAVDTKTTITDLTNANKTLEKDQQDSIKRRDKALTRAQDAETALEEFKTNASGVDEAIKRENETLKGEVEGLNGKLTVYVDRDKEKLGKLLEDVPEEKRGLFKDDLDVGYQITLAESLIPTKQPPPGYRPPGGEPPEGTLTSTQRIAKGLAAGS